MVLVNQATTTMPETNGRSNPKNINSIGILQDDEIIPDEIFLEVSVINPITRKERDGELVTTYAIYIETNDTAFTMSKSMVRRRYSEFAALRAILEEQHPSLAVPKLPGKTLLGKRFDQRFIQERCRALQQFLKAIVEQPVYLSNKSLHLFLQTSLSMDQVQHVVNGCESYEVPHNNTPLILFPVDNKRVCPPLPGRVGILKQEPCASLASCPDRECSIKTKHQHMRVGSGIVVCPFSPGQQENLASSAPFNIPGGSPASGLRTCASDTCLDGNIGSLVGSKKRVSFMLERENKQTSLLKRIQDVSIEKSVESNDVVG